LIVISQQRQGKEDEGILLLREVVNNIRKEAKLKKLAENKQVQT
jgi:hypothetical protein